MDIPNVALTDSFSWVQGLFSQAILQSGNVLCPWAMVKDPQKVSTRLAATLGCSHMTWNTRLLMRCFKGKNAHEIVKAQQDLSVSWFKTY